MENVFNPSKRKDCKGEILAQNLQRAGFEVVKCDKFSSHVCNPCAGKIQNLGSLYSFVQRSLQGKVCYSYSNKVNFGKQALTGHSRGKESDPQSSLSTIAGDQNKKGKVLTENFGICAGKASSF